MSPLTLTTPFSTISVSESPEGYTTPGQSIRKIRRIKVMYCHTCREKRPDCLLFQKEQNTWQQLLILFKNTNIKNFMDRKHVSSPLMSLPHLLLLWKGYLTSMQECRAYNKSNLFFLSLKITFLVFTCQQTQNHVARGCCFFGNDI